MLLSNYSKHLLLPEKQYEGFTPPAPTIPNSLGHHKEWLHACKTGAPTTCHFGYSGPLTESVLIGNVAAHFPGETLQLDAARLVFTNRPEASEHLSRDYRRGWRIKGAAV